MLLLGNGSLNAAAHDHARPHRLAVGDLPRVGAKGHQHAIDILRAASGADHLVGDSHLEVQRLAALVAEVATRPGKPSRIHPATRVFQALRIAVNDELGAITRAIPQALNLVEVGGRVVVMSFQSLEDKIVKEIFVEASTSKSPRNLPVELPEYAAKFSLVIKASEKASQAEQDENSRSTSVRLRAIERVAA